MGSLYGELVAYYLLAAALLHNKKKSHCVVNIKEKLHAEKQIVCIFIEISYLSAGAVVLSCAGAGHVKAPFMLHLRTEIRICASNGLTDTMLFRASFTFASAISNTSSRGQ